MSGTADPDPLGGLVFRSARLALRRIRQTPWSSLAVVAVTSVGIAGIASVFSIVNTAWLRPLPNEWENRLVKLSGIDPQRRVRGPVPREVARLIRRGIGDQADIAAFNERSSMVHTVDGTVRADVTAIDEALLRVLRMRPLAGRAPTREEYASAAPVLLAGEEFWRRALGEQGFREGVMLDVDGAQRAVIGLMPSGFRFPWRSSLWVPLAHDTASVSHVAEILNYRSRDDLESLGNDALASTGTNGARERPWKLTVEDLQYRGNNVIASSLASGFFIVSALLLLAAALTAGSLLQARTLRRQRAHATALALGASRADLVRDAIVEHAILAVSAAALAIGLTSFAVRALQTALPQDLPGWIQFGLDWRVVAFVSCVLALVMLVHALAAAREIGRVEPARALAEANAAVTPGVGRSRHGAAIVRAQVLLMSPLVVSASIVATQHASVAWGWDATGLQRSADLLVFQHDESKKDLSLRRRLSDEIAERMEGDRRIDLLTRYGAPTGVRGGPDFVGTRLFDADGVEGRLLETEIPFLFGVDSVYFAIRAQPILRGRHFVPSDSLGPTLAMIVESSAAAALWGSADAVGRRARIGSADGPVAEVVGVVADRREPTVSMSRRVVLTGRRQVYLSKWQVVDGQPRISVRASSSVEDANAAFVEAAAALDPGAEPLFESLGEKQRLAMLPLRLVTSILVAAAAFVHALAIIGVFALVRLRIADRRQELGVRLAVGASPSSLRAMLVRDVWREIIPGLVVGVVLSCAAVAVALKVTTMPTASIVLASLASLGTLLAITFLVVATSSANVLGYSPAEMLRNRS